MFFLDRKNLTCIGCAAPRPLEGLSPSFGPNAMSTSSYVPSSVTNNLALGNGMPSPRFRLIGQQQQQQGRSPLTLLPQSNHGNGLEMAPSYHRQSQPQQFRQHPQQVYLPDQRSSFSLPSSPITPLLPQHQQQQQPSAHAHILTPSGHALSIGGRVRNISSSLVSPCLIFWSDNEPLPEECQVRPAMCGVQPPIMNTGNRGPIERQIGDWTCGKCRYLVSLSVSCILGVVCSS